MRIGSSLSGMDLVAQHNLQRSLSQMDLSSVRLSTMQRLNSGSDDPAGLIAAESLRSEITAIKAASYNAARAQAVVHTADSALGEVSSLLNSIRGNVVQAAGGMLSDAELSAKQIEVDAALNAIDRIGSTATFNGHKLLDGDSLSFVFSPDVDQTSTLDLPGIDTSTLGGGAGMLSDLAGGGIAELSGGDLGAAIDILDAAGSQVTGGWTGMAAFEKYTVESAQQVLGGMEENVSAAFSQIYDTDVAEETSRLIRSSILVESGTAVMAVTGQRSGLIAGLLGWD